jgi:uncharacterized membrane protein YeaQ/YmgE (transglycosylase-associated protein family)
MSMPWKVRDAMSERLDLVTLAGQPGADMAELQEQAPLLEAVPLLGDLGAQGRLSSPDPRRARRRDERAERPRRPGVVQPQTGAGAESMSIIWAIIIGFIAGMIAKYVTPGDNKPGGFVLTTILGIAGAFVATWLGQAIGWYGPDDGAGLIGATVGAVIVLLVWGYFQTSRENKRVRG